jgi:microcystin-dependent protein
MAEDRHDGGGKGPFSFTFPSIKQGHIKVSVNNQDQASTAYFFNSYNSTTGGSVEFNADTASGTNNVRIYRKTDGDNLEHTFQVGSSIKASDLNDSNKQSLFLAEENRESINSLAAGDATGAIQISGSNIADDSITTSKILDLEVKSGDISSSSSNDSLRAITTDHIRDDAVTTSKIADDAVTTDKLANSINTTIAGKANTGASLSIFNNDTTNYITLAQAAGAAVFTTGMIMMFTGSTAPTGWVFCDNSAAAQAANAPDLRDRFIVGTGSTYSYGNTGGSASVTLNVNQIPSHTHTWTRQDAVTNAGYRPWPGNNNDVQATTVNTSATGGGQSHENRPPYYALAFIMKT